jgi:hypothetical protein
MDDLYREMCQSPASPIWHPLSRATFDITANVVAAAQATARVVVILVIVIVLVTSIAVEIAGEKPARHCIASLYWV